MVYVSYSTNLDSWQHLNTSQHCLEQSLKIKKAVSASFSTCICIYMYLQHIIHNTQEKMPELWTRCIGGITRITVRIHTVYTVLYVHISAYLIRMQLGHFLALFWSFVPCETGRIALKESPGPLNTTLQARSARVVPHDAVVMTQ